LRPDQHAASGGGYSSAAAAPPPARAYGRSFRCFGRKHAGIGHDHRLTDVERADRVGNAIPLRYRRGRGMGALAPQRPFRHQDFGAI
jgi:hypothetical protein